MEHDKVVMMVRSREISILIQLFGGRVFVAISGVRMAERLQQHAGSQNDRRLKRTLALTRNYH